MNLLAAGRSLLVGAGLGVLRTPAGRADPLVFTPFEAALRAADPQRLRRVQGLAAGATFAGIGDLLAAGEFTATELTLAFLARIRVHDEALRSIIELNPEALVEAGRADERRRAGQVLGPLDGVPLTFKDRRSLSRSACAPTACRWASR